MSKYYLRFSKTGIIKYISHLDLQRLFKRAFKTSGIPIEYSKGYNPHPKMGFAQPLSLGYTASKEYLEFETVGEIDTTSALEKLASSMPQGIDITEVGGLENLYKELNLNPNKSLAASVTSAVYSVTLPLLYRFRHEDIAETVEKYMAQPEIMAKKREKKTKKIVDKDIKNQIRSIRVVASSLEPAGDDENRTTFSEPDNKVVLLMELDSGSQSNLSPEQVISSFTEFSELYLPRDEIEVNRDYMCF